MLYAACKCGCKTCTLLRTSIDGSGPERGLLAGRVAALKAGPCRLWHGGFEGECIFTGSLIVRNRCSDFTKSRYQQPSQWAMVHAINCIALGTILGETSFHEVHSPTAHAALLDTILASSALARCCNETAHECRCFPDFRPLEHGPGDPCDCNSESISSNMRCAPRS